MQKEISNFLFPKRCLCCSRIGDYVCKSCFKLNVSPQPYAICHVCQNPVSTGFQHRDCSQYTFLNGMFYVSRYNDFVKHIVHEFKYNGVQTISEEISTIMHQYMRSFFRVKPADLYVTEVPLHPKRMAVRGFNQAELIARKISTAADIEYQQMLSRVKNTKTQVGLRKEERGLNLHGVFKFTGRKILRPSVLLIDDVFTTGATMNQCAKVLKQAGFIEVYGFTLARD